MLTFIYFTTDTGRLDYFKSSILRSLVAFVLAIIYAIFGVILTADAPSLESSSEVLTTSFINLLLFTPITFRRANDIDFHYAWLAPLLLFIITPVDSLLATGIFPGLIVLYSLYMIVISLILTFKPGQIHKKWLRSR